MKANVPVSVFAHVAPIITDVTIKFHDNQLVMKTDGLLWSVPVSLDITEVI